MLLLDDWRALDGDDEDDRARFPEDVFVAVLAEGREVRAGDETLTPLELAVVDLAGSIWWLLPILVFALFLTIMPWLPE